MQCRRRRPAAGPVRVLAHALRAGAREQLVKGADEEQIVQAMQTIGSGDMVFGSAAAERALAYFTAAPPTGRAVGRS